MSRELACLSFLRNQQAQNRNNHELLLPKRRAEL